VIPFLSGLEGVLAEFVTGGCYLKSSFAFCIRVHVSALPEKKDVTNL